MVGWRKSDWAFLANFNNSPCRVAFLRVSVCWVGALEGERGGEEGEGGGNIARFAPFLTPASPICSGRLRAALRKPLLI